RAGTAGGSTAAGLRALRSDKLVQLNLVYLQRVILRPSDRIEIHVGGREKNDRHIKTVGRVRRVDVCLKPFQISVPPFFQNELQVARIFPRSGGLGSPRFG